MVFQATLSSPLILKQIIDSIKDLVKECNLDCNDSGLQIQCTDSSNVALIKLSMRESAFETFKCDKPMTLGINMEALAKIMKFSAPTDKVTIHVDDETCAILSITFSSYEGNNSTYTLRLITIETDPLGIPEKQYDAMITGSAMELKKSIGRVKDFGDTIKIRVSKEDVGFTVRGDCGLSKVFRKTCQEPAKEETTGSKEDDRAIRTEMRNPNQVVELVYNVRFIAFFIKAACLSPKKCRISMSEGSPIIFTYFLGEEHHGDLSFMVGHKDGEEDL